MHLEIPPLGASNDLCLRLIKQDLVLWYRRFEHDFPRVTVTRISNLTPKMVGPHQSKKIKLKAMEAHGMLRYLVPTLRANSVLLGAKGAQLASAGECLLALSDIMKDMDVEPGLEAVHSALECWKTYIGIVRPVFEDDFSPKHHMMFHLLLRCARQGKPALYYNFMDESLNKDLKKILRNVHQVAFERLGLLKAREYLKRA